MEVSFVALEKRSRFRVLTALLFVDSKSFIMKTSIATSIAFERSSHCRMVRIRDKT